jgi:hypothetical protein
LGRFRCAALSRRLRLTVWRRRLRGGGRRREDKCRDDREFVHIGRLRALLQHQSGQARRIRPTAVGSRVAPREMSRSLVCSTTAFVGRPTVQARRHARRSIAPPPDRHFVSGQRPAAREIVAPANGGSLGCDIGHRRGGAGVRKRGKHGEAPPASRDPIKKLGASDELFNRRRQPATLAPHYRPGPSCVLLCSATGVGIFELRGLRRAHTDALSDVAV